MISEPSSKFGRRRDELPTASELLASINQPLPFAEESERQVLASWLSYESLLDDPGMSPDAFVDDAFQTIGRELLYLRAARQPLFADGFFSLAAFKAHLGQKGLLAQAGGDSLLAELVTSMPIPAHYAFHKKIVLDAFRRRQMIHALCLGIDRLQRFGREEGETLEEVTSEIHQRLSDIETDDDGAELPARPVNDIIIDVVERAEERIRHPGKLPGVSTGFKKLDELTGGLQAGRLWTILAESSNGKSMLGRQLIEEACEQGHAAVIYTYEMMDYEEVGRMICSQGRLASDKVMLGTLHRTEMVSFKRAADAVRSWKIAVIDVAGRVIEDIHRDIKRRARKLAEGQHLIVMIDYPQIAKARKKCANREQEIAYITGETKQCAKSSLRTTIILPSQVNKEGDARESMAIEQDSDVKLQIVNPNQKKNARGGKVMPWEQASDESAELSPEDLIQHQRRKLYIGKNRGGKKGESIKVRMHGEIFRFEQDY